MRVINNGQVQASVRGLEQSQLRFPSALISRQGRGVVVSSIKLAERDSAASTD